MNRILTIALIGFVILIIIAIFISPLVDVPPSALRVQQWLSFIVAMFSFAAQLVVCFLPLPATIGPPNCDVQFQERVCVADLACCLIC